MKLKEVFITRTAVFFPNNPISNDEMEGFLGLVNNNESKSQDNTDTIIQFNMEEINKDYIRRTRQFNISPIVRRTPNTKADIIIQKIYTNRKNVIKNYQNTSTNISSSTDRFSEKFTASKNDKLCSKLQSRSLYVSISDSCLSSKNNKFFSKVQRRS